MTQLEKKTEQKKFGRINSKFGLRKVWRKDWELKVSSVLHIMLNKAKYGQNIVNFIF